MSCDTYSFTVPFRISSPSHASSIESMGELGTKILTSNNQGVTDRYDIERYGQLLLSVFEFFVIIELSHYNINKDAIIANGWERFKNQIERIHAPFLARKWLKFRIWIIKKRA